jgi:hypothetical protein
MRTTVTLDPDVAAEIERIRMSEGRRFKHVLNEALRLGLQQLSGSTSGARSASPTMPMNLGRQLTEIRSVSEALIKVEGEFRR